LNQNENPFQPPEAEIEPVHQHEHGELLSEPRSVPAGNGTQWISAGWELFKASPWLWIGMLVVTFACFMVASFLPLVGMLSSWLFPMFLGGWMIGCQRLADSGELRFEDLFAGFSQHFKPLAIASLIYLGATVVLTIVAMVIAGMLGFGIAMLSGGDGAGLIAFAILIGVLVAMALMVPLLMMIWFAPALIVLHQVAPVEALKMSFQGCLRNIVPFLIYGLVGMLMLIIGAIPLMLGWLVVYPVLMCAVYTGYRDIFLEDGGA
jgi:hypothetical protein